MLWNMKEAKNMKVMEQCLRICGVRMVFLLLMQATRKDSRGSAESDGYYHYKFTIPKELNGATPYTLCSEGCFDISLTKTTLSFTTINPIDKIVLSGWRYYSNPVNSFGDLFNSRSFSWPW